MRQRATRPWCGPARRPLPGSGRSRGCDRRHSPPVSLAGRLSAWRPGNCDAPCWETRAARELERTYRSLVRRSRLPGARIPYYRKDYPAFIEKLEALARSAQPGELPPALGPVLEEHRTQAGLHQKVAGFIAEDLPRLEALPGRRRALRRSGAEALTHVLDREPHAAWSGEAEALTAAAQELLDGPQYKPHLRAASGATRRIRRALDPVSRQLADDRETQAVLRDWRALAARARQWRPAGVRG